MRAPGGASLGGLAYPVARTVAAATQAAPLPFGKAAPDAEFLTVVEGVLETLLTYDTTTAYLFCLSGGAPPFREEEVRVDP